MSMELRIEDIRNRINSKEDNEGYKRRIIRSSKDIRWQLHPRTLAWRTQKI